GPSGSGKSTLLAALAGVLPDDAHVDGRIDGIDADSIAWAPQTPRAFAATPREELALYGAATDALDELGLARLADAAVAELSPGEQRRLAVARALARVDAGARLLVLDEPTAHLDPVAADLVRAAVRRRAGRCTIVLASHEPDTPPLAARLVPVGDSVHDAAADRVDGEPQEDSGSDGRTETGHPSASSSPLTVPPAAGRRSLTLAALLRPHAWLWAASM